MVVGSDGLVPNHGAEVFHSGPLPGGLDLDRPRSENFEQLAAVAVGDHLGPIARLARDPGVADRPAEPDAIRAGF